MVATVPTVYGIETVYFFLLLVQVYLLQQYLPLRYWNPTAPKSFTEMIPYKLQQYLPFTVCAEGGETAEEQSDDEVRTSQVPERSEGKTKVTK